MPRPTTPAPMTMVFGRWAGTIDGALMTDSLHRACPARFSGSDLSRRRARATPRHRAAPQPHANFKPSPSAMQGFSAEGVLKPRRFHRGARSARAVNLLAMFVGHALPHALLCGTRCPHGHPPLSLEAAFGGLLFVQTRAAFAALLFLESGRTRIGGSSGSPTSPRPSPPPGAERESKGAALPSPPFRGEREGPIAERWEGEVGWISSVPAPPRSRHRPCRPLYRYVRAR